jgi:probable phosphoglycerate mutase
LVAQRLASEAGVTALYTSPLQRAQQTAEIIGRVTGLAPCIVPNLAEWDFNRIMSGKDRIELRVVTALSHIGPFRALLPHEWATSPTLRAFVSQVATAIQELVDRHPSQRIIVVAHGGTIDALLTHYFPAEEEWERGVIKNCSLTQVLVEGASAKLLSFNDCECLT